MNTLCGVIQNRLAKYGTSEGAAAGWEHRARKAGATDKDIGELKNQRPFIQDHYIAGRVGGMKHGEALESARQKFVSERMRDRSRQGKGN
ncbi:MAG: hypothetical protein WC208_08300 [Gallionella sp.]|jgi:hypothetical protein